MLIVKDIVAGYSKMPAIHGVSFKVEEGQIVAILGSNGAGKTTTLKTVMGILPAMSGSIVYKGESLIGVPSHKMAEKGISMVPEGRHLFPRMSIYDNLMLGAYSVKDKDKIAEKLKTVYEIFPILAERKNQMAGTMSGGEQQMVAIGRALMCDPQLLILDEPSLGIMPKLVDEIFEFVRKINRMGVTIVIIEQNAEKTLAFSDYAYVISEGETVIEGTGQELMKNDQVQKVYLGMD
ncbi:MAG TPA: ABC transporter ATP-binding protein [Candidatus Egerieimonas intestinavium]|uniref:ABC transporter ATP-binding protein n=1 Tax=Candidatus Egerieimonas intestinavium TaxID=2840777 RepID=A0A9D1EIH7_9FIRM|nr:ABC transporter ATP-binding protein [Candidatus Egerieimonas intestinavium]